jgi:gentisate 1,2-dioxygenase
MAAPEPLSPETFQRRLESLSMGPLWTVLRDTLTPRPTPRAVPYQWRWADVRPLLYESARQVSAAEAERRVLMLLNPGLPGETACAETLYAGIQIICPGEIARTHRHAPNALRFIMEGSGAFSTVDGERVTMRPGDLVITPTWTWHDHGNEANETVVWLDGLDIPLVQALAAMFFEPYPAEQQAVVRPSGDSRHRYAAGLRPSFQAWSAPYSPVMAYPFAEARAALEALADAPDASPFDDVLMQYINPLTGGPVLPTLDAYLQRVRPHHRTAAHRHTAAVVYLGVEGEGVIEIDGRPYAWRPNDVIVVPSWALHCHENPGPNPAVLFSFTNAPVLRAVALYREDPASGDGYGGTR